MMTEKLDRGISIHALREEGDRPPHSGQVLAVLISIHALREEGDSVQINMDYNHIISIHALREEGDRARYFSACGSWVFLSTPSARRATGGYNGPWGGS